MQKRKNIFGLIIILFLLVAVFLTAYVVRQRQEIRKRASTGTGSVTMSMSASGGYSSYFVGEKIPLTVTLNSSGANISGVSLRITGNNSDFDFVTNTGTVIPPVVPPTLPIAAPFNFNSSFPNASGLTQQLNTVITEGTLLELIFSLFDMSASSGTVLPSGNVVLGTFYVIPKRVPTGGQLTLTFEPVYTIVIDKVSGEDILRTPSSYTLTISQDITPPIPAPTVTDDGAYTSSSTQLHATWSASDPESGIAEYQYAIGIDTGANKESVVPFTSVGTNTSVTRTGLGLTIGRTYYFSVKAKNGANLWSSIGSSDGITTVATTFSFGLKLQGMSLSGIQKAFTVIFRGGSDTTFDSPLVTSSAGGVFTGTVDITGLPFGNYQVLIKDKTLAGTPSRSNHLRKNMGPVTISGGGNVADWSSDVTKRLRAGDVDENNNIQAIDLARIINRYINYTNPVVIDDSDLARDTRDRDLDNDGNITALDIGLFISNYYNADNLGDQ